MQPSVTASATRGRVSHSTPRLRGARPAAGAGLTPAVSSGRTRSGRDGQNAARPSSASSAGMSVTETATATRTVTAIAGPKARKMLLSAASMEAVPAATVIPATATIGANSVVAVRAEPSLPVPWRRLCCTPDRKKIA